MKSETELTQPMDFGLVEFMGDNYFVYSATTEHAAACSVFVVVSLITQKHAIFSEFIETILKLNLNLI